MAVKRAGPAFRTISQSGGQHRAMRWALLVLLAMIVACDVLALPLTPRPRQLTVSDGMPSNRLYALAEDGQGYLWIGTVDGLVRYDGYQFRIWRIEDGLPSNAVYAVAVDSQDRIWVGTEQGVRILDKDRRVTALPASLAHFRQLHHAPVLTIEAAPDGTMWVSVSGGLYSITTKNVVEKHALKSPDDAAPEPGEVISIAFEAAGRAWLGMTNGTASLEGRNIRRLPAGAQHMPRVNVLTLTRDGALWIGTGMGVSRYDPKSGGDLAPLPGRPESSIGLMLEDSGGNLWFETDRGLGLLDEGRMQDVPLFSATSMGIVRPSLTDALEDHEGGLWFATADAGLWYLPQEWSRFSVLARRIDHPETLGNAFPAALALADGSGETLWTAGSAGILEKVRVRDGVILHREQGMGGRFPLKLMRVRQDGDVWLAHFGGLVRYDWRKRAVLRFAGAGKVAFTSHIAAMVEDGNGTLWVDARLRPGLQRMDKQGRWLPSVPYPAETPGANPASCLVDTPGRKVWICSGDRILEWDDARAEFVPVAEDVPSLITAIVFDRMRPGVFHAFSGEGVFSYRKDAGSYRQVGRIDIQGVAVGHALQDRQGVLWAGTRRGLLRLDPSTGRLRLYTMRDGLPGQEVLSNLVSSPDGRWIAGGTPEGLFLFDPRTLKPADAVPRLQIEAVDAKRENSIVSLSSNDGSVHLRARDRDFRVDARLTSFRNNGAHVYQFRMNGVDADWVEVGTTGERMFPILPPGRYLLDVRAADADGVWSETITIPVLVDPPWWRTGWALSAFGVLALALLALMALEYRARVRRQHAHALSEQRRELAEQASQAKTRFLANLGHEVRTPLTGVMGMSELLLGTSLQTRQRGYAESIHRAGEHLLRLVNDALDLARVEAGRLELDARDFDLRGLIREVVDLMAPLAERGGLQFSDAIDAAVPATLHGDRTRVEQILLNLLGNAIKFTDSGHVTLEVLPLHPQGVRLLVGDSGPGMTAEQQERLFRRFEQAEGAKTSARYGGSGLGLAISQELALAMGGGITVHSTLGEGTVFTVDLPLPSGTTVRDSADGASPVERSTILLVEDDPIVADVIIALLRRQGHAVVHATHALEALTLLSQHAFDLALLDLDLPGIDGIALAAQLRAMGFDRPLVALTARADGDAQTDTQAAGFDGFLRKPVTGAILAQGIARVLAQADPI